MNEREKERKQIQKKLKKLEKYRLKLYNRLDALYIEDLKDRAVKDGLVFIDCCDYGMDGFEIIDSVYHVPIKKGKVHRDKAFIIVYREGQGKRYNIVQPEYMKQYTDQEILNSCDDYYHGNKNFTGHAQFYGTAILPL